MHPGRRIHPQGLSVLNPASRTAADARAITIARQHRLTNINLAPVTLNIAPEYSLAMFGKLINESSATYNHILTALSGAKRIEALMEVDNKAIASLNYWQGLFMLRHSPGIAWYPLDQARIQRLVLVVCAEPKLPLRTGLGPRRRKDCLEQGRHVRIRIPYGRSQPSIATMARRC